MFTTKRSRRWPSGSPRISPERIHISGRGGARTLPEILAQVARGLGCGEGRDARIEADLHKLLIYNKSDFFAAHRDSEKADGMFGTLVIALPSAHRGGALAVRHAGREERCDLRASEPSELRWAAFYADCEHEVLPVEEGTRICLIFNLRQPRAASPLRPTSREREVAAAAEALGRAFAADDPPEKIAWLLDHQYSQAALAFSTLKGRDAALAQTLAEAGARVGRRALLAIVKIEEGSPAEPEYYDGYWGRDSDEEDFEIVEVHSTVACAEHWRDERDRSLALGRIEIGEGEILPPGALDDETPDECRLLEATGNEGCSFERLYRRAAIILWPAKREADILAAAGAAAPRFVQLAERAAADPDARAEALRLLDAISPRRSYFRPEQPSRAAMTRALLDIGEHEALVRYLHAVVLPKYDGKGAETAAIAELLNRLAEPAPQLLDALRDDLQTTFCENRVWGLSKGGGEIIANLLLLLRDEPRQTDAARAIVRRLMNYDPRAVIVPALDILHGKLPPAPREILARAAAEALLKRAPRPPVPPANWRIVAKLRCGCPDCQALIAFMRDPQQARARFPLRKDRRKHLHREIDGQRLELDHATERSGSPYTLILNKNRAAWNRAMTNYRRDIAALQTLARLNPPAELLPAIRTALAAAKENAPA